MSMLFLILYCYLIYNLLNPYLYLFIDLSTEIGWSLILIFQGFVKLVFSSCYIVPLIVVKGYGFFILCLLRKTSTSPNKLLFNTFPVSSTLIGEQL